MKPISYNTFIDKHYYNAWIVNEYDNTVALWPKNSPCEREMDKHIYLDYIGRLYNTKFESISEYRKKRDNKEYSDLLEIGLRKREIERLIEKMEQL